MARRQVSIFINGREVANNIKAITDEKRKVVRELRHMTVGSEEYIAKMKELERLNGTINQHNRQIRGVGSSYAKITGAAGKFLAVAGIAFTVDGIISYGTELFKAGVEMDQLERKARTVLGPALAFVEQKALDNASAMGLTTQQYVAATTAIADILIPMGFQRDRAAEISTNLVDLSGALSEWSGGQRTAEEVTTILGKALTGEREQLKELGIVIQEADVKARLAQKGLSNLTGEFLQQAKAAATLELITEKSSDAQTSFADNSDSLIRKQAELSAKITDVSQKLAKSLLPVFDALVDIAVDVVDVIANIGDGISSLLNPAKSATEAFESQKSAVQNLESDLNPLLTRYEELASKTNKSEAEQQELKKVIIQIGKIVPTAITEFDKYGDALGISADKARDFIEAQKLILQQKNQTAIKENTKDFEDFNDRINEIQKALSKRDADGDIIRTVQAMQKSGGEINVFTENIKLSGDEIQRLQSELDKLQEKAKKSENAVKILSGEFELTPEPKTGTEDPQKPTEEEILRQKERAERLRKEREKQAEQEAKDLEKKIEKLNELTAKARELAAFEQLSEDEQALERIRQKYQQEIDLAKELQSKGHQEATAQLIELERLRDQELSTLRDEQAALALEKDLERIAEKDQVENDAYLASLNARREAENLIAEELRTEQENALLELELYYFNLISLAEEYGIDTTEITAKYNQDKADLNKKFREEEGKAAIESQKKQAEALASTFGSLANIVGGALAGIGDESTKFAGLTKVLSLAQIGFKSAEAIASAVAASAGVPFPGNLVAIGTAVGTVLANIGQAKKIFNDTKLPQRRKGGYFGVTGADDGRSYNAQYIGSPQSGMLPAHPVVLASESGPEYFVSNRDLQNPAVANYVRMIDNISRNRVAQFQDGGTAVAGERTEAPPSASAPDNSAALTQELNRLNNILESGIFAMIDDDAVVEIFKKFNTLNEASGGSLV